jgi:hypothetical protein
MQPLTQTPALAAKIGMISSHMALDTWRHARQTLNQREPTGMRRVAQVPETEALSLF